MVPAILVRAALLAAIWWTLTEGDPGAWGVGVPVIALALLAGTRLQGSGARFSIAGIPGFLLFFLSRSMKGGAQVAWMAVRPEARLDPVMLDISLRLPGEAERVFLVGMLSLLPGTLSVGLEEDRLQLHALDKRMPVEVEVRVAEARVARLFGLDLQ